MCVCVLNLWAWHLSCWEICFSHALHPSFILSSITSCFITFMHLYGFLDHLYVSRVKLSSFLYPLSIMTKRGRIYGEIVVSFYKILHVIGRNTCLCKGEMCFILLGGVLISFFLYLGSCDHVRIHWTYLLYMLMYVFFTYLYKCCFFSLFIHMFLYVRNLYLCFTYDALMSFV